MKICTKCNKEKELKDFKPNQNYKSGYDARCKECFREYNIQWQKKHPEYGKLKKREYVKEDPNYFQNQKKEWDQKNKEHIKEYKKRYESTLEFKQRKKEHDKKFRETHQEYYREYRKQYYQQNKKEVNRKYLERKHRDPRLRMIHNLRSRLNHILRGRQKSQSTLELLGCSLDELKAHIEKQFTLGMSWNNYGKGPNDWSIDHIIPLTFGKNIEEIEKLCHYTNLKPMWHIENMSKGNRI